MKDGGCKLNEATFFFSPFMSMEERLKG